MVPSSFITSQMTAALVSPAAFYWVTLAAAVAASFAMWRFLRSPFGLSLRGIRDSESRMRSLGYNVPLHLLIGFTVSGLFAGLAGALYAVFNNFVSPSTVALTQSVAGLLMMIAGGVGTLFGGFVGAAAIITLENLVSAYTERWPSVLGLTFIAIMIFAPEGIIGKLRAVLARRLASEQPASRSGISTVLAGFSILAVSAMKWTPAMTIMSASTFWASRARSRESPVMSLTQWKISGVM